jgi:predicted TIM-barrel fold metal-dependent hydrolase
MIVDCHTHIWQTPEQLGQGSLGQRPAALRPARLGGDTLSLWRSVPAADPDHHWAQSATVDRSIVLGFKSSYLRAEIPNRFVADYVRRSPDKLIGFAGIDPTQRTAVDELRSSKVLLGLRGLTLSPANQDFHPTDSRAMRIYAEAERLKMPVVIHPCSANSPAGKMEYSRPFLLDEVARTFPGLKLIISQVGYPWVDEAVLLLTRHANVFADVSGILAKPWMAYNVLVAAYQAGVFPKLLFGSDFPYTNATECIEALYSLCAIVQGTHLPLVPRQAVAELINRDALTLLGIAGPAIEEKEK